MASPSICAVDGCDKPAINRHGWCNAHYLRWRRHGDPLAGRPPQVAPGTLSRWLEDHASYDEPGCLVWPFSRAPNGYPNTVEIAGRVENAHRMMCLIAHGEPPTRKHQAAHSCGNGTAGCCNPRHLRWATAKENNADKTLHGTVPVGKMSGTAVVTNEQVLAIHRLKGTAGERAVAKRFGVNRHVVTYIWKGRTWSWLTGEIGPASS